MNLRAAACFAACIALATADSAIAQTFQLDTVRVTGADGVVFEETSLAGTSVPLQLERKSRDSWVITIDPADFRVPSTSDGGTPVEWSLSSPARGFIHRRQGTLRCNLDVPLVATVAASSEMHAVPLRFTTEQVRRLGGTRATGSGMPDSKRGSRLQGANGEIVLVAAGSATPRGGDGSPDSMFIDLRGRLLDLPPELRR